MEQNKSPDKFPLTEILAVVLCNLGQVCCGLAVGWLSPAIPQMTSGILANYSQEETINLFSWMAGGFPLVAVFVTPLSAIISEYLGRRTCAALVGIPFAINALIIVFSSNVYWILAGRFILGIGVALCNGNNQVFVGEAVRSNVRGKLGSLLSLSYTFGVLCSYIIGGFVSYSAAGIMMLFVALCTVFLLFIFVPETPAWLVKNNKLQKAYKSVAWYRRKNTEDIEVITEINQLIEATKIETPSRMQAMKHLVHSKAIRRGFLICLYAIACQGYIGMISVQSYAITIFMQSGAGKLSAEGASVIYGTLQVLGALSTVFFVDKFGRKFLFAASSICVCLCMYTMAIYFQLQSQNIDLTSVQWLPVTVLSVCVCTYTVGLGSVPFIFLADLLPNEVRSSATMIVMMVFFSNIFVNLFFFGKFLEMLGPYSVFYFFGTVSGLTFISSFFVLLETKGKTMDEIIDMLSR